MTKKAMLKKIPQPLLELTVISKYLIDVLIGYQIIWKIIHENEKR